MTQFKVGDAVRLTERGSGFTGGVYPAGSVGFVDKAGESRWFYDVKMLDGRTWPFTEHEIEPLETSNE